VYCLDPEKGDIATRKLVASVQCHEVAHQWFGNITTMEWWDNLYLVSLSSAAVTPINNHQ
jgi:aminopeptidase 2